MMNADRCEDVTAVVVTYSPGEGCGSLLLELSRQCGHVVVVDNASDIDELESLRRWCSAAACELVELAANMGIAAAQNIGIARARAHGARKVLLSDDDSVPTPRMVARLSADLDQATGSLPVAAVGPLVGEVKPGGDQLVYRSRTWGPRRATSVELARPLLPVAFLIASGCLIDIGALNSIGPMNEGLFIDHVDLEWGLRARNAGFALLVDTRVLMAHSLGDATVHVAGRAQPVHVHGPTRNYYLSRNTVLLIRSGLLGWRWSIGYLAWLIKYMAFNVLLVDRHRERFMMTVRGLRDGLRGRGGRLSLR